MKKIRCVIIEDEKPTLRELEFLLSPYEMLEVVGVAETGVAGLELIRKMHPDLVFLDISMPVMSGIEVASKLMFLNDPPEIIFTTAHSEHAVSAFELNALDYLLKPYDEKRIHKSMERVKALFEGTDKAVNHPSKPAKSSKLPASQGDKILLIPVDSISYCCADKDRNLIVCDSGTFECPMTLCEILERTELFRIHRSYLVNLSRIFEIYPWFNGTYQITLNDKQKSNLIVSRSYVKMLKQRLSI
jgi:two-component system response regulator LytT